MSEAPSPSGGGPATSQLRPVLEIAIRLGLIFGIVGWCLYILAPFAGIVVWALIIAIALHTPYERLASAMGGHRGLAATLVVVISLGVLVLPAVLLSETLVRGAQAFAGNLASGQFEVPPAPPKVERWPLVGPQVYELWSLANQNVSAAIDKLGPQLKAVSRWLLGAAGSAGVAMLQLAASLVLAGFFLARSPGRLIALDRFASRVAGDRGPEFSALAHATVSSVVQGIVGVAVIQATLAGVGFIVAGVPAAGLWALLVLIAAVIQVPVALALIVPVVLVFSKSGTSVTVAFAAWCLFVSLIDNVLKPLLFGRGSQVPMIVIFLGAIGGMLTMGIVGLFLGAVVLALGYELFMAWLQAGDEGAASPAAPGQGGA